VLESGLESGLESPPRGAKGETVKRIERDSLGEVEVPANARYGPQTQRAVANFPISGVSIEPGLIHALGLIKAEAARVNAELDGVPRVDARLGGAIAEAADQVADGQWDLEFPVDSFQTGSGTSSNMNANEVIASIANDLLSESETVHPNDHVNASQSSNDVFPSAIHLAALIAITAGLLPALRHLEASLRRKQLAFADVVKAGRTHLMDATPIMLGQEFGGYAAQIGQNIDRLTEVLERLGELPLGGTAVGTGINAPPEFAGAVIARLIVRTNGLPLAEAKDHFAAQGARDALVETSGHLRTLAVGLIKIANDVRWMGSGPHSGLNELRLPALQPGSSIMPGKVNPVMAEVVTQVGAQVIGNDVAVTFGGSQGSFELNTFMPLIARNVLESIRLLSNVVRLFADHCIDGLEANVERMRTMAEASSAIGTVLTGQFGYEKTAEILEESTRTGQTIRAVVVANGLMSETEAASLLNVDAMTRGWTD